MAGQGLADGQPVVLKELEGDGREIQLLASDMPRQGVVVGGELRRVTTWYPGAQTASTQVLGTKEREIELNGWLRDTWEGLVGGAAKMMQDLRDLWLGQRYCELTWGTLVVRRGYIADVEFRFVRETDIEYRLTFQPTEAQEAVVLSAQPAEPVTPTFTVSLLRQLGEAAEEALSVAASASAVVSVL